MTSFNFNGYDLSEILIMTSDTRGIRLGRSKNYQARKNKKGVQTLDYSSELVTFETSFVFIGDVKEKENILADVINVDEPKPLIFSDEPTRVYYAFPKSEVVIDKLGITGSGTITWEIPDGVSYSLQTYEYINKNESDELTDTIIVNNLGFEDIDLELEATFTSDNGFLGIENETGSVKALFGNMAEVDGFDYQVSEVLFDDHLYIDQGWTLNDGVVPPVASGMLQQGSVTYQEESSGEGFAWPTDYGSAGTSWSGPSLTKTVPADSNGEYALNWTSTFRADFNTDGGGSAKAKASQIGHQSFTFIDQYDNIIAAVVIEDNTPGAEKSDFAVYVKDRRVYDSRNTSSYYNTARPGKGNHIKVEKMGGRVTVELAGIGFRQSFPYPDRTSELRKVTFYAARYKTHQPMHNNLLRAMNIVKHHVDKWKDIPNKFKNGDVLKYGKGGRNIYCLLNEMNELRMRDVGSTLISAPPGRSAFYLAYSEFSDTPEVKLKGRAKYI